MPDFSQVHVLISNEKKKPRKGLSEFKNWQDTWFKRTFMLINRILIPVDNITVSQHIIVEPIICYD